MLFQDINGKFIEIYRMDYVTDAEYYIAILRIKGKSFPKKFEKSEQRILKAFTPNISNQNQK